MCLGQSNLCKVSRTISWRSKISKGSSLSMATPGQSKDKVFVFKILVNLLSSGAEHVKHMQLGGDMENSWMKIDHIRCLKD